MPQVMPTAPLPGEARDVAARASADDNARLLDRCPKPHRFMRQGTLTVSEDEAKIGDPSELLRCVRCQGVVTQDQARWYARGYKDKGK